MNKKSKTLPIRQSIITTSRCGTVFGFAAAGASLAAFGGHAHAQQVVIQDIFTSGSQYGTPLGLQGNNSKGVTPTPVDLPGGPWQHITGAWYDAKEFSGRMNGASGTGDQSTPTDFASFHNSGAVGVALGPYNSGNLHVTAGVCYLEQPGGAIAADSACIFVGFSSLLNSASNYGPPPVTTFTGLAVSGSGALQEYVSGTAAGKPIAFQGTYSPYSETLLSYTINTTTGAITGVNFGNSTARYSFPAPKTFQNSYTANTELSGVAGGANLATVTSYILASDSPPKPSPTPAATPTPAPAASPAPSSSPAGK